MVRSRSTTTNTARSRREPAEGGLAIGIDIGTSGCRAIALDSRLRVIARQEVRLLPPERTASRSSQDPEHWWIAVCGALRGLLRDAPVASAAIAVAGTSATCLLCDARGHPLTAGLMYDDSRAHAEAGRISAAGGGENPACHAQSSLSKLLWWGSQGMPEDTRYLLHQADWITARLTGVFGTSDYNNSLKLGFDAVTGMWPPWFSRLPIDMKLLPRVVAPGTPLGAVRAGIARALGLPKTTTVVAGTTDSVAAFLASGACVPGDAVSSFGSTIALKLLTETPVTSAPHGVYSHRLGHVWLAGGASNAGGGALAAHFTPEELDRLTARIDPGRPTGLCFYPLPGVGERFPIADPGKRTVLEPRPADPAIFLHAMIEGLAQIEAEGYALLARLGASPVKRLWTSGRTADNPVLRRLREQRFGKMLQPEREITPAAGAARLAACALEEKMWHSSSILATLGAAHARLGQNNE
ncbi:MAG: FGGY-family carbohydrate kinase [Acidiferrobacteraceae bacterium]